MARAPVAAEQELHAILAREREAIARLDGEAIAALAEEKERAAVALVASGDREAAARLRALAAANRDLLAYLHECLRAALLAVVAAEPGPVYGPALARARAAEPIALRRRYG